MSDPVDPAPGRTGRTTRRALLAAVAVGGAGGALGGCTVYGGQDKGSAPDSGGQAAGGGSGATPGEVLTRVSDLPVGGGVILADRKIVVTRADKDTVRAFSAVCTHAGCTVSGISEGVITCPCHGSTFRVADGSVAQGPASAPLPAIDVGVDGDEVTLA
jgi:Rieske Fe-S protein